MNKKILVGLIAFVATVVISLGLIVYGVLISIKNQKEIKATQEWKIQATTQINTNTQNIGSIINFINESIQKR